MWAAEDTSVYYIEFTTAILPQVRTLGGHTSAVRGVWGSEDIGVYYSGSEDCQIMLWDAASGKQASLLRRLLYYRILSQRLRGRRLRQCVCVCVCVCVCIHTFIHTHTYTHTHIYRVVNCYKPLSALLEPS